MGVFFQPTAMMSIEILTARFSPVQEFELCDIDITESLRQHEIIRGPRRKKRALLPSVAEEMSLVVEWMNDGFLLVYITIAKLVSISG